MSGVYIRGMKMPQNCWNCPFLHTSEHYIGDDEILQRYTCLRTGERTDENFTGYLKNCPLVAVPDHGRLISAKRIEFELCESTMPEKYREFCRRVIRSESLSPTIIPADKKKEVQE